VSSSGRSTCIALSAAASRRYTGVLVPRYVKEAKDFAYKITHMALLAHCNIPSPVNVPRIRTFIVALEALLPQFSRHWFLPRMSSAFPICVHGIQMILNGWGLPLTVHFAKPSDAVMAKWTSYTTSDTAPTPACPDCRTPLGAFPCCSIASAPAILSSVWSVESNICLAVWIGIISVTGSSV
jgi:hypothetical protein